MPERPEGSSRGRPAPAVSCRGLVPPGGEMPTAPLDLDVAAGDIVLLSGRAGVAGLLRCLVGVARPAGGSCRVLGHDPRARGVTVRRRVGYAPREPGLPGWMSAREAEALVAAAQPAWDGELFQGILELLEVDPEGGAGDLEPVGRARLAVALALGHRPHVLLLDEPLAAAEPSERAAVLGPVLGAARESGMTVLLGCLHPRGLGAFADRAVLLARGGVLLDTTVEELGGRFHRAVLRYPEGLPSRFSYDKALRAELDRDAIVLLVEGKASLLRGELARLGPTSVEMHPLPFDEAVALVLEAAGGGEP